ncbi:LysE family translocator [Fusobacterium sp.]|uniref:LysE family translocator n=1 Tax=Fusobacterium sp. TaxID=68766 RepID=UPI00396CC014
MDLTFFKGIITGLLLSIPFGPVGIYCMEKALLKSPKNGYISALGMITVDVIYGITALFFISQVEETIIKYEMYLQILIGLFLIFVGWKKFREQDKIKGLEKRAEEDEVHENGPCSKKTLKNLGCCECSDATGGLVKDYFTTFFIALANISSVLTIVAIFTALKVYVGNSYKVASVACLGIFLGGATEWFITTYILSHFTKVLDEAKLIKISRFFGVLIFLFGIFITGSSFLKIVIK